MCSFCSDARMGERFSLAGHVIYECVNKIECRSWVSHEVLKQIVPFTCTLCLREAATLSLMCRAGLCIDLGGKRGRRKKTAVTSSYVIRVMERLEQIVCFPYKLSFQLFGTLLLGSLVRDIGLHIAAKCSANSINL